MKTSCLVFGFTMLLACGQIRPISAREINSQSNVIAIVVQGRNEISGTVFDDSHRPVADVYIELLDDVNSTLRRAKTSGSGRFTFPGLVNGTYKVRVLPYGTDYLEQIQEVTLAAVSAVAGSGADRQNIDIQLRLNERAVAGPFARAPGAIFAQDVPQAAKKLYQEGISFLREKKEQEGFDRLKKALEIFPDYYVALDRLGAEYALRGTNNPAYLQAGYVLLTKAVQINPRGFSSVFGLGWTQYQLGMNLEAIENLRNATTLYAKAADAYLWLGKALRRASNPDQAEVAFNKANQLTDGKSSEVHWQLATLYNDQKRYKDAADQLELFLKFEPKAADAEKIRETIKQLREKVGAKS